MQKINCRECRHYYITFDAAMPYGCRAYGFKTRGLPSLAVFQSSGIRCTLFLKKENPSSEKNDDDKDSRGGFYA